ncbi:WD40/YVTN/BNR-like repeat-containing protein [Barrientosiimonas endolithica]|uniref:Exo-alpha-sialidase n=1 Tax=Barrientosiimonas endolithica TaxID=1535208 RepID=A0ABM8HA44_9MICO|nr:hypothetical protein [Barrientosiimonas endolithica]BDZ57805.1 hypothetical protein GCM10025872_14620 [Barrientosiimonas endolithica]
MSERDSRDPRPVEEFFAAERAAVHPAEAGEDRWEQIVHQSTRGGRPWFALFMGALGALAAVVLFWSTQQAPFGEGSVDPGREVEAATNNAPVEASGDPRDTSPAQAPIEVPASFVPWSMSNAGSGTVFAMGAAPCGADEEVCPTVVRSTDNGSTWTAVHRFQRTDTASVTSDEVPRIQPPRAVSEVRFATPKIGYAFGGDLWMTRDAGRSFTRYAHPGQTVLDVEIFRGDVLVLSADGCSQGRCSGPLMLSRTTVQAGAVQQPVAVRDLDTPVDDAQVVVRDGAVYVQPYRVDAGNVGSPWRLEENQLVPMTARDGCGTNPLQSLTASTNGAGTLFALCGGDLRGDQAEYRLMRSDDRGKTWRPATTTPVVLPRVGRLTLAASDAQHLAVATGGRGRCRPRPGSPTCRGCCRSPTTAARPGARSTSRSRRRRASTGSRAPAARSCTPSPAPARASGARPTWAPPGSWSTRPSRSTRRRAPPHRRPRGSRRPRRARPPRPLRAPRRPRPERGAPGRCRARGVRHPMATPDVGPRCRAPMSRLASGLPDMLSA